MVERFISSQLGGPQPDSYYFQLYPINLSIIGKGSLIPAPGTTYKFAIIKGTQKFDENKIPIEANFRRIDEAEIMVIPKCPLNFYLPNFTKGRKIEFGLKLYQTENNEQFDVGDIIVNPEDYINKFKNEKSVRFEQKAKIADDYELEYEVYVQKSRFALQKIVKEFKTERSMKSPLKQRKDKSVSSSTKKIVAEPVSFISKIPRVEKTEEAVSQPKEEVNESKKSFRRDQRKQPTPDNKPASLKSSRAQSKVDQPSEQAQSQSGRTGHKAPLLMTRIKPVSADDKGKAQVHMTSSQRLQTSKNEQVFPAIPKISQTKQKILMIIFLVLSLGIMYFAMHPNSKV